MGCPTLRPDAGRCSTFERAQTIVTETRSRRHPILFLKRGRPRAGTVVMAYTGHSEIARQGETDPPKLDDLQDFITCYNPENRHERVATERFKFFS